MYSSSTVKREIASLGDQDGVVRSQRSRTNLLQTLVAYQSIMSQATPVVEAAFTPSGRQQTSTLWKLLNSVIANSVKCSSLFVLVECVDTVGRRSLHSFNRQPECVINLMFLPRDAL